MVLMDSFPPQLFCQRDLFISVCFLSQLSLITFSRSVYTGDCNMIVAVSSDLSLLTHIVWDAILIDQSTLNLPSHKTALG